MWWMAASSPIGAGARVRRLISPEQWEGTPMRRCSSRSFTRKPLAAMSRAVREPAGPAPITATSQSYLVAITCILWYVQPFRALGKGRDEGDAQEEHDVGDAV